MPRRPVLIVVGMLVAVVAGSAASAVVGHAASTCSTQWQIQASGSPGNYANELLAVTALDPTDAWSVGYAVQSATSNGQTTYTYTPLFEHWNGTAWSVVPGATQGLPLLATTVPGEMRGVWGSGPSDVWAVGDSGPQGTETALIEHWNGSTWSVVTPASGSVQLNAVWGSSAGDVWAVGGSAAPGTGGQGVTQHWNGSAWQTVSGADAGVSSWVSVSGASPGDVWAFGDQSTLNGAAATEHWDGVAWTGVAVPNPFVNTLHAASITATTTGVWLVGVGTPQDNGTTNQSYAARWTGSTWQYVTVPVQGRYDELVGAASSNVDDGWYVGAYRTAVGGVDPYANSQDQLDARHWDGQSFTFVPPVASGLGADGFRAVATAPGQTWAVGASGPPRSGSNGPFHPTQSLIESICAAPAGGVVPEAPAALWLPLGATAAATMTAILTRRRRATHAS